MDATASKLIQLMASQDPELRIAAIRIVSEVGLTGQSVVQALGKCLREPRESLQILALRALGRHGAGDIAQIVVPLILSDGVLREHAMTVITAIGPKAAAQLQAIYDEADSGGKRAIVTALAGIGGKTSLEFLLERLPTEPFEIQKHLISNICDTLDVTPSGQQAPVFALVSKLLGARDKSQETLIGLINILGHFKGQALAARARSVLVKYAGKKQPAEIRRYALVSLNRLIDEAKVGKDYIAFLQTLLLDPDWQNVAQHALTGFQKINIPGRSPILGDLLSKSPHFPVQSHVFTRLESFDRPEIGQAIVPFLADQRLSVKEKAEDALRRMPSAVDHLLNVLQTTEDVEVAQRIVAVLTDYPLHVRKKYLENAAKKLIELFEDNDDRYRLFLEFIRSVDSEPLRKRIYQKTKSLKSGRSRERWEKISVYLQLLWDNHLITPEGRYIYAVALLHLHPQDLAPAVRRANLGLQVIRALIYDDYDHLVATLKKDSDLKAEDYFYLGFHFTEEGEQTRPFGLAMLKHVMKKFPRGKVAKIAAHKLETQLKFLEEAAKLAEKKHKRRRRKAQIELDQAISSVALKGGKPSPAGTDAVSSKAASGKAGSAKAASGKAGAAKAEKDSAKKKAAKKKQPSSAKKKSESKPSGGKKKVKKTPAKKRSSDAKSGLGAKPGKGAKSGKKAPPSRRQEPSTKKSASSRAKKKNKKVEKAAAKRKS